MIYYETICNLPIKLGHGWTITSHVWWLKRLPICKELKDDFFLVEKQYIFKTLLNKLLSVAMYINKKYLIITRSRIAFSYVSISITNINSAIICWYKVLPKHFCYFCQNNPGPKNGTIGMDLGAWQSQNGDHKPINCRRWPSVIWRLLSHPMQLMIDAR